MKEIYIEELERAIARYMAAHPRASWQDAYDAVADEAYERLRERLADMIDMPRLQDD